MWVFPWLRFLQISTDFPTYPFLPGREPLDKKKYRLGKLGNGVVGVGGFGETDVKGTNNEMPPKRATSKSSLVASDVSDFERFDRHLVSRSALYECTDPSQVFTDTGLSSLSCVYICVCVCPFSLL